MVQLLKSRRTLIMLFAGGLFFPVSISWLSFCCISADFLERNRWFIVVVRSLWVSVDWLLDDVGSGWTLEIAGKLFLRSVVNGIYWAVLGICFILGSKLLRIVSKHVRQRKKL